MKSVNPTPKFRKLDEDTYEVVGESMTVRRCWYRVGGWQWEVPEVMNGRSPMRNRSRRVAVIAAIAIKERNARVEAEENAR